MRPCRRALALILLLMFVLDLVPPAQGCGPSYLEPIFVFRESPDPPFEEFTRGKIGIVQPTFGRKTLFIAFRYLNGASFTGEEQQALVQALRGMPPEEKGNEAIKQWLAAREQVAAPGQKLPEIYRERRFMGYDFFPNCAKNAFEVAAQTLKDRIASYGADDPYVRDWLAAQDMVFTNCSAGEIPAELGAESPSWARKDRAYQIAASHFYSLNFDEARRRFEAIAADAESPWQKTAEYLVARTLVRQASLTENEERRREIYQQAEVLLQLLVHQRGDFQNASLRLLGLVKYRTRPAERVQELARALAYQGGNLRQDLIDYVWLLEKFEAQIEEEEQARKKALENPDEEKRSYEEFRNQETTDRFEAVRKGDLISIGFYLKQADGQPDYRSYVTQFFKHDASDSEIIRAFEDHFGKKFSPEETKEITRIIESARVQRAWSISSNRKVDGALSQWKGCYGECEMVPLDLLPSFLRSDELSDWIMTIRSKDPSSFKHAESKWLETGSPAWLVTSLVKAEASTSNITHLIREGEKISPDSPAYLTVVFQLVRLKIALQQRAEARKHLDEVLAWPDELLPASARNQFAEQRTLLADNVSEFLRFAQRKPAAFYSFGTFGGISRSMEIEKGFWNAEYSRATKEEHELETEQDYEELLAWEGRVTFDDMTVAILNRHFPLSVLAAMIEDPVLPDYLRRSLMLAVWTRAILLDNEEIARGVAYDLVKAVPGMGEVLNPFLNAESAQEGRNAALYALLKFPTLSPFVKSGIPRFSSVEDLDYYLEISWWCTPSDTEYDDAGNDVPIVVPEPSMLTAELVKTAREEHAALQALGDGNSYLGKLVLEWARTSPKDPRLPEALYIAAQANESYKFGCNGWSSDEPTNREARGILRESYPQSPWTEKLRPDRRP